ncbi:DUF998 domain-containing protein [Costertonia aggregata]|uniref:DUF998 domain-containing protein n=1 Tax=Costertonia aggregata TaxID=343403 RepID=A0A7H9ASS8_9FLAO|nr:DUF998 domain-containing protein [Costertonia aggregata]QLG46523.1 DUF998 domain-containing protein [Costertonia aggregata]
MTYDRGRLINYGGMVLILGCASAIIADIIGILVYEDHNPIRQTISQLAHGKFAYIQDIGLVLLSLGILSAAVALYVWKSNDKRFIFGAAALSIMGIGIGVLAEFNQLVGEPGTTIHIVVTAMIGTLFLFAAITLGIGFKELNRTWAYTSIGIGISVLLSCLGFLFISEKYEGFYERGVVLFVMIWFLGLGYVLYNVPQKRGLNKLN